MKDDDKFDEAFKVYRLHKVTMEQLVRFIESSSGSDWRIYYADNKILLYDAIRSGTILDNGKLVIRVDIPEVHYVEVDSHKKYILVKTKDGEIDYTDNVGEASSGDMIVPVLDFPTGGLDKVMEKIRETSA